VTPVWFLSLILGLISGCFIRFSVLMVVAISAFWLEVRSLLYPLVWLYDFTRFPLDVYGPLVRGLLTYAIPYGLASYYPAAYLLRPTEHAWAAWGVPLIALAMTAAVYQFWLFALDHYASAGG
jgi:ABC-2 type transport system permease protein